MIPRFVPFLLSSLSALLLLLGTNAALLRSEAPAPAAVDALLVDAVTDPLGLDYTMLRDRLGEPLRMVARPVPNAYEPGQIDTFRTVEYPGLTFALYEATAAQKTILSQLTVTDPAFTAPSGLRVGMVHEEVLERVGAPTVRSREQYVYEATDARPADLTVAFEEGEVTALNWVVFFE